MEYVELAYFRLSTVVPAAIIGTFIMATRKGTKHHKFFGKIYMVLILITAVFSLLMPAVIGPRLFDHFGWIHLFSLMALVSVPGAYISIKRAKLASHKGLMIGLYMGGILLAGSLAFLPGRLLHSWFIA